MKLEPRSQVVAAQANQHQRSCLVEKSKGPEVVVWTIKRVVTMEVGRGGVDLDRSVVMLSGGGKEGRRGDLLRGGDLFYYY